MPAGAPAFIDPSAVETTRTSDNRLPEGERVAAWGPESFENDDALDWVADLADGGGMDVVQSAFEMVVDGEYLEGPEASAALAAAEVVAALAGRPLEDLPEEAAEWVAANQRPPGDKLLRRARAVVQRVRADSELKELREEEGGVPNEWHAAVDDLLRRLEG